MRLRPAQRFEIPRLQEIEKRARARYLKDKDLGFVAETSPISAERLEQGEVIVAEENGRPLGFVLTSALDGMLYIANISVELGFSGRGVGAALLAASDEVAPSKGSSALVLTTFKTPRWNGPWFRKLGFEPIPERRIGPELHAILDRHRMFLDMSMRETLWRPVGLCSAPAEDGGGRWQA